MSVTLSHVAKASRVWNLLVEAVSVSKVYGELSDITTDDGISLKSSEELTEYRLSELADATGINYLYNGQYGVETDANGLYYMRARYYNQDIKRFINRDVVSGDITNSQSLNRYCYVQGNPVSLTDPFGLCPTEEERKSIEFKRNLSNIVHGTLDAVGLLVPGMGDMLDAVNAIIYAMEGNIDMAIISLICTIPIVGSLIGLPIKYAMKYGIDVGTAFLKFGIRNAPEITEGVSRLARAMKSKYDNTSAWFSKKFAKITPDGGNLSKRVGYSALGEMSETDGIRYRDWNYEKIYEMSIHNPNSNSMTLGKYLDGTLESGSYVALAESTGDTYFSLGTQWDEIKDTYGLSDKDMFNLFNTRALDDAVAQGKVIRFSQNPLDWTGTALSDEWNYLQSKYGYSRLKKIGDYWYAK